MKTAVIMQPTYLPWLGYFDLMDQGDVFVFLDSVQFAKRSWQQRNRIKTVAGELMLTVPVLTKGKREQRINEAKIDQSQQFQEKHIRTISSNYSKAANYKSNYEEFASLIRQNNDSLAELNIKLICWLKEKLNIRTEILRSSDLNVEGEKAHLLVNICNAVGADAYLSAAGSKVYIDEDNPFPENGIKLLYHEYEHPLYQQLFGEFLPFMSTIDLLLNEGERGLPIIKSGRKNGNS